jgi:signal transduction histidine kinase
MEERKVSSWLRRLRLTLKDYCLSVLQGRLGIHHELPKFVRYGFSFLIACIGVWLRVWMNEEYNHDALRLLSIIAVALSAWVGGLGPGLLATLIGLAGSAVLTAGTPPEALAITHPIRLFLFLMTGLIVSGLTEALSRTAIEWKQAEEAQEKRILQERNRMAREIHDTLAQGLTGIIIQLEVAEDILEEFPEEFSGQTDVRAHLIRAKELARTSLTEARRSVAALRPITLEGRNLTDALKDRLLAMTAGMNVNVEVTLEGTPYYLADECEDNLLRIGLEALTNALKHAQAQSIRMHFAFDPGSVTLSVKDDGNGFVVESLQPPLGFGLVGMQERAERIGARLTIESRPGQGTEVRVTAPRSGASLTSSSSSGQQKIMSQL